MKKSIIIFISFFLLFSSVNAIKVYESEDIGQAIRYQFSKDFKSMIYVNRTASGTYAIFKDDKKLGEYPELLWGMGNSTDEENYPKLTGEFAISADGTRYAYGVLKENRKYVVIENGKEGEEFDRISWMSYEDLGRIDLQDKLGYHASNTYDTTTHDYMGNYIIIDGKRQYTKPKSYDDLIVSPDGTKSVYIDYKCGVNSSCVVENGVKGEAYLNINNRMKYSPDSKYLLYIAQKDNGNYVMVINGIESEESKDEIRWTDRGWGVGDTYFIKKQNGINSIYENFNELYSFTIPLGYNRIGGVVLSPDKTKFAFEASKGDPFDSKTRKSVVVENGVKGKEYGMVYSGLEYSPDSKRLSYMVEGGNGYILVENGVELIEGYFPDPGIREYSPDSKYLAYNYVSPTQVGYFQRLFLNDKLFLTSPTDESYSDFIFIDDNHFIIATQNWNDGYRNNYLSRVTIKDEEINPDSTTIEKTYQNIKKEFDERYGDKYINSLERVLPKKSKEELENLYNDFNRNYIEKESYERLELVINYVNAGILYYISLK